MSLMLAANGVAAEMTVKIRSRIAEGASVVETSLGNLPAWFAAELNEEDVDSVFWSRHALVAVLRNGRSVVRGLARA